MNKTKKHNTIKKNNVYKTYKNKIGNFFFFLTIFPLFCNLYIYNNKYLYKIIIIIIKSNQNKHTFTVSYYFYFVCIISNFYNKYINIRTLIIKNFILIQLLIINKSDKLNRTKNCWHIRILIIIKIAILSLNRHQNQL